MTKIMFPENRRVIERVDESKKRSIWGWIKHFIFEIGEIKTEIKTQTVVAPTQVGGYYFPVPEPGQPTAILIGVGGPVEGQQFSVEKELFHVGASPENDLYIAEDNYVSGNHAYIRYERGSLFIFDMNSRNGTLVNQGKVTDTGLVLSLGDRIRVGMSMFEVTKAQSRSGVGMRTLSGTQGPSIGRTLIS